MTIENKVNDGVPFMWYVEIHKKYNTVSVNEVLFRYQVITDHLFEKFPNQRREWYQEESIRRTENYFRACKK